MKIAVSFLYVLLSILYLSIGDSSRMWGGINLITHLAFIGWLCYLMEDNINNTVMERLFFSYLKYLSIANCVYIVWCVLNSTYWSIYHTDIFAYILGISFAVLLIHAGYESNKNEIK